MIGTKIYGSWSAFAKAIPVLFSLFALSSENVPECQKQRFYQLFYWQINQISELT